MYVYIYMCVYTGHIYIYIHICLLYLLYFYIGFVSLLSKYSGYCEYETLFTLPISNVQYLLARPSQLGGPLYKTKKRNWPHGFRQFSSEFQWFWDSM